MKSFIVTLLLTLSIIKITTITSVGSNKTTQKYTLSNNQLCGNQNIKNENLNPNVSITDACIDWDETEELIRKIHKAL